MQASTDKSPLRCNIIIIRSTSYTCNLASTYITSVVNRHRLPLLGVIDPVASRKDLHGDLLRHGEKAAPRCWAVTPSPPPGTAAGWQGRGVLALLRRCAYSRALK